MKGKEMDEAKLFTEVFGDGDMFVDKNLIFVEVGDHYEVEGYNGSPETLIIPSYYKYKPVTVIRDGAFSGQATLSRVAIGESISVIGKNAFSGCAALGMITIPGCAKSIGEGAFSGCRSLASVNIPCGVEVIGEGAFSGYDGMKIYCYEKEKPEGWHENWAPEGARIKWNVGADAIALFDSLFD